MPMVLLAKPDGRIAMEKLLKLNDKDIFISLLKGDHPAGRIYAAEGLLRLENSKENVDLINQIFSTLVRNGIRYTTSHGCIIMDEEYEFINMIAIASSLRLTTMSDLSFLAIDPWRV